MSERARKKDEMMNGDGIEMGWRKKRRERLPPLLPPQFPILAGFRLRSLSAKPFLQGAVLSMLLQSLPLPHLAPSISASDQSRISLLSFASPQPTREYFVLVDQQNKKIN
jgi:hypothetical protein